MPEPGAAWSVGDPPRRFGCVLARAVGVLTWLVTSGISAQVGDPWETPVVERRDVAPGHLPPRTTLWWRDASHRRSPAPDATWHPQALRSSRVKDPALREWVDVIDVQTVDHPKHGSVVFALDRGRLGGGPIVPGGAKLVAMSPLTGRVVDAWWFDPPYDVSPQADFRCVAIDLRHQAAFIHDAGTDSLLVLDLATRRAHTVLAGDVGVGVRLFVGGDEALYLEPPTHLEAPIRRVPVSLLLDPRLDPGVVRHFVTATSHWVPMMNDDATARPDEEQTWLSSEPSGDAPGIGDEITSSPRGIVAGAHPEPDPVFTEEPTLRIVATGSPRHWVRAAWWRVVRDADQATLARESARAHRFGLASESVLSPGTPPADPAVNGTAP